MLINKFYYHDAFIKSTESIPSFLRICPAHHWKKYKMKYFVIILVFFIGIQADKERAEDLEQLKEKLLIEIEKRLHDSQPTSPPTPTCPYPHAMTYNTIIKAKESIDAHNAFFISADVVDEEQDCMDKCCNNVNCNTAIYKNERKERNCYMFNCGKDDVCQYANDTKFSVIHFLGKTTPDLQGKVHREDLDKLAVTTTITPSTTTTKTTTTTTTSPTTTTTKEPALLFKTCQVSKDCAGSKTVCMGGFCICQDGYHAQDGECRQDCSRFQFACANEGQPLATPQCIAIYDTCDGIDHCQDGSDERNCAEEKDLNTDNSDGNQANKDEGSQAVVDNGQQDRKPDNMDVKPKPDVIQEEPTEESEVDLKQPALSTEESDNQAVEAQPDQQRPGQQQPGPAEPAEQDKPEEKVEKVTVSETQTTPPARQEEKPTESNQPEEKPEGGESSEQPAADKPKDSVDVIMEEEEVDVSDTGLEKAEIAMNKVLEEELESSVPTSQGAVIALALGLAVTVLLLMFVGCRLRTVKRRLRRGRPLNSNEADYLINGMYL